MTGKMTTPIRRLWLALLSGCVALAAAPVLDIPFVQQTKTGCGSAAVAMLIQYWAQHDPELLPAAAATEDIDRWLPASRQGIQGEALKRYLETHGFDAFVFNGEEHDLIHHLDKGRPVVVCLAPGGNRKMLHYAVVAGIDESSVWLNDSARGKLFRQSREDFMRDWNATGNWSLLAVPRQAH